MKTAGALLILTLFSWSCLGQEINLQLISTDTLKMVDFNNIVYDINGEVCNLIILNTELDSIKFYSNRGVEKIEHTDGIYRIWTPPETSVLKIQIPRMPLYEYRLPEAETTNSIYVFYLSVYYDRNIVYRDTLRPFISFSTRPSGAKLYVNNIFFGRTPKILMSDEGYIFNYALKKSGYEMVMGSDTVDDIANNFNYTLKDLTRLKRYFLILSLQGYIHGYPGLTFGKLGKTGWYTNLKIYNNDVTDLTCISTVLW